MLDPRIVFPLMALVVSVLFLSLDWREALLVTSILFTLWVALMLASRGSAKFDDMLQDVADALVWVHDKKKILGKSHSQIVFGGYSSGGHVAASLLQRPDLFVSRGLPKPERVCDAVIMISGVLAVRPPVSFPGTPRWLTDMTVHTVFGKEGALTVPSPLHDGVQPKLPHLLIGCKHEMFGINWLDIFFCSRAYCKSLQANSVPATFVEISSDHWNILNSTELSLALRKELRLLSSQLRRSTANEPCPVCRKFYCNGGHALASTSPRVEDVRSE